MVLACFEKSLYFSFTFKTNLKGGTRMRHVAFLWLAVAGSGVPSLTAAAAVKP